MSQFTYQLAEMASQLEEMIAQVASEKMQAVLEDLAEDHIPDVVEQKVQKAFEQMDLPGHILRRIEAVDLQVLVRNEVEKIVVRLLEQQLGERISNQSRAVLLSDEDCNLMVTMRAAHAKGL